MGSFRAALRYQLQLTVFSPVALLAALLNPLVYAVLIATQASGMSPRIAIAAGLSGIIETGVLQAVFFVLTERSEGTLVSLALTPAGLRSALLGRSVGALLQGVLMLPVVAAISAACYGWHAVVRQVPLALCCAVLGTIGLLPFIVFIAGYLVEHRYSAGMLNGLTPVLLVVSGIFFSVGALPIPLRVLSAGAPLTWSLQPLAESHPATGICLLLACGLSVVWSAAAWWRLSGLDRRLRGSDRAW